MNKISNKIVINGTIVGPMGKNSGFPTHSSEYGRGGWTSVGTYDDLVDIPSEYIIDGMGVLILDTKSLVIMEDNTWKYVSLFGKLDDLDSGDLMRYDGSEWVSGLINGENIGKGVVDGTHIKAGSISGSHYVFGSVNGACIAEKTIGTEHIKVDSIDSRHIVDGEIGSCQIRDKSIMGNHIQTGEIYDDLIHNDTIGFDKLTKVVRNAVFVVCSVPDSPNSPSDRPSIAIDDNSMYISITPGVWKKIDFAQW